jgi:hypothetical protein
MRVNSERYRKSLGRTDPRVLHLKIRVVLTRAMTAETARLLLHRAIDTGIVPPGIAIRYIDWQKEGVVGQGTEGKVLPEKVRRALRDFYGAMQAAGTRFEKVSPI